MRRLAMFEIPGILNYIHVNIEKIHAFKVYNISLTAKESLRHILSDNNKNKKKRYSL